MSLGILLSILSSIVIARLLDQEGYGVYSFFLAMVAIFTIPLSAGLPLFLTRNVARGFETLKWNDCRELIVASYKYVVAASLLLILAVVLTAGIFQVPLFAYDKMLVLVAASFVAPFMAMASINSGIVRGFHSPLASLFPQQILQPLLALTGVVICSALLGLNYQRAIGVYFTSFILVFTVSVVILFFVAPAAVRQASPVRFNWSRWSKSITTFAVLSGVIVLNTNLVIFLLGLSGQDAAAAQLRVAERGAQLVVFPIMALENILASRIVAANSNVNKLAEMKALSLASSRSCTLLAVFVSSILIFGGETILHVTFGSSYSDTAYRPMVVLILAQLVFVMLGSSALFLTMSGFEVHGLIGNILSVVIICIAASFLMRFGAIGGALSFAAGLILSKIYFVLLARIKLGFWTGVFG